MVKVYLLCIDAFPETDALRSKFAKEGFIRKDFVCNGAFTCSTLTSIVSGKLGSEIISGGIGASSNYRKDFHSWKEGGFCLFDLLRSQEIDVHICNHIPWMSSFLVGQGIKEQEKDTHYRDWQVEEGQLEIEKFGVTKRGVCAMYTPKGTKGRQDAHLFYSSTHPDLSLRTFTEWGNPQRKEAFYLNEGAMIAKTQGMTAPMFFFTDLCHFHEAAYYPNGNTYAPETLGFKITKEDAITGSMAWLDLWDFNEKDAIFFLFADHSHRVLPILDPESYITWCYVKNNTAVALPRQEWPIITSADLYSEILAAFEPSSLRSLPFDPSRTYICEDGRGAAAVKDRATTFLRCRITGDEIISVSRCLEGGMAKTGVYVIQSLLSWKYSYKVWYYSDSADNNEHWEIKCAGPLSDRIRTSLDWSDPPTLCF